MRKIKTFLIDLVTAAILATAIILVLDATDNMISNVSLSLSEKIVMAKVER